MDAPNTPISRAEHAAVRAERDQLLTLLKALPDISFVIDEEGLYVRVIGGANEAMYADGKALEGQSLHDALPTEVADRFLTVIRRTIETGQLQTLEYTLQASDVSALPEEARLSPRGSTDQWFEGRVLALPAFNHSRPVALWVAVNITTRKALELYWRDAARTDSLTGLANRQRLFELAQHEVERSHRYQSPLCLLMIDVDHFKRINDRYGHAVGDEALKCLTRACQDCLREADVMGRTGGEEFAVVLPETDTDGAIRLAERLLATVRSIKLSDGADEVRPSISIGCACLRPDEDLDQLMRRADEYLYAAKAAGRDQLKVADDQENTAQ